MQTKMVILPSEDGFNVLVWGKQASGSMRLRSFDNRANMTALLESLHLITPQAAAELESFAFLDSCPIYSPTVDEATLEAHGFRPVCR